MAATPSTMPPLGMTAPAFTLPDARGRTHSLEDFSGSKGLLVAFICPHCPFVVHIRKEFGAFARVYRERGLAVVAIVSNNLDQSPQDGPEGMLREAEGGGYDFPYLLDESQDVAKAYGAVCTPDFFGFDRDLKLRYRGRLDAGVREEPPPGAPRELVEAMRKIAAGEAPEEQVPSIGCSIKWRAA